MLRRGFGTAYIRGECLVKECHNQQRTKGLSKTTGKKMYDKVCNLHHRIRYGLSYFPDTLNLRIKLPNDRCSNCGWDKAGCDRHRLIPENGYIPENILILCPNCHRLKHLGLLENKALLSKKRGELNSDDYL